MSNLKEKNLILKIKCFLFGVDPIFFFIGAVLTGKQTGSHGLSPLESMAEFAPGVSIPI